MNLSLQDKSLKLLKKFVSIQSPQIKGFNYYYYDYKIKLKLLPIFFTLKNISY